MRRGLETDAASASDVIRRLSGEVSAGTLAVMKEAQGVDVLDFILSVLINIFELKCFIISS